MLSNAGFMKQGPSVGRTTSLARCPRWTSFTLTTCSSGALRAGTSVKTVVHWAQAVRSPRPWFRRFDYGVWCLDWRMRAQVGLFIVGAMPRHAEARAPSCIEAASGRTVRLAGGADPEAMGLLLARDCNYGMADSCANTVTRRQSSSTSKCFGLKFTND